MNNVDKWLDFHLNQPLSLNTFWHFTCRTITEFPWAFSSPVLYVLLDCYDSLVYWSFYTFMISNATLTVTQLQYPTQPWQALTAFTTLIPWSRLTRDKMRPDWHCWNHLCCSCSQCWVGTTYMSIQWLNTCLLREKCCIITDSNQMLVITNRLYL